MFKRIALGLAALLAVFVGLSVFGGSLFWHLIGVGRDLEISGRAPVVNPGAGRDATGWPRYGQDAGGNRYSAADQITPENVSRLEVAWTYRTGDLASKSGVIRESVFEATPVLVEGMLIFCTPFNEVVALDPGTGEQRWRYDPEIDLNQRPANKFVCRGVSHWRDPDAAEEVPCAARIFTGTNDARLIALDARTGAPCKDFADNGQVRIDPGKDLVWPGEFQITSPPAIIGDTVIVGSSISDNVRLEAPFGTVRAYDARTGALRWSFDPIPRGEDDPARATWPEGGPPREGHANVWAVMSVDEERDLVFLPTSSPSPDFYGGLRAGDNLYTDSVVALRGSTGEMVWHFQAIHHDVWDYDLPAQPGLYTVRVDGEPRDVVAQVTKTGLVFVLDRDTGEPVLPVEERGVPQNGAPGEVLSPTQPFPVATPPLVPTQVTPDDAFGLTFWDRRLCAAQIRKSRADGLYTPPSLQGTILYPFTGGGANWGSAAFDSTRNLLVVNVSSVAHIVNLIPSTEVEQAAANQGSDEDVGRQTGAPFGSNRKMLMSPIKLPCTPPSWGMLAAVDLVSGQIVWRKTLGTTKDLAPGAPALKLGTPNLGGPVITASGLVFIGATMDHYLRAFDVATGRELWKGRLPASGVATPMTYEWEGRQYVVIAAGGYVRLGLTPADHVVAFALPPP
ncbi:MAG: pyrroloquinoline quinone-dependent dehydrogenase, partial [Alphaproteobacteria bacterium]